MLLMLRKVFPDEDTNALLEALNELIQEFQGRIDGSILLYVVQNIRMRAA